MFFVRKCDSERISHTSSLQSYDNENYVISLQILEKVSESEKGDK